MKVSALIKRLVESFFITHLKKRVGSYMEGETKPAGSTVLKIILPAIFYQRIFASLGPGWNLKP
jgi:hypothetical protein